MTGKPLQGIRACVFDAYGTIFDFASAAARSTEALGDAAARLTALWRDKQLQYSWLRAVRRIAASDDPPIHIGRSGCTGLGEIEAPVRW